MTFTKVLAHIAPSCGLNWQISVFRLHILHILFFNAAVYFSATEVCQDHQLPTHRLTHSYSIELLNARRGVRTPLYMHGRWGERHTFWTILVRHKVKIRSCHKAVVIVDDDPNHEFTRIALRAKGQIHTDHCAPKATKSTNRAVKRQNTSCIQRSEQKIACQEEKQDKRGG